MADKELWDDLTLDTTPANTDRIVKQSSSEAEFDSVQIDNIGEAKFKVTAAGDIVYADGNQSLEKLAIGLYGKLLAVNSGATAPEWRGLYGFDGEINAQTGTTYTIQASDNGKVITLSNAAAITVTVPNSLTAGFNCLLIQLGAGQVSLSAAASGNIRNYNSQTSLAGQYAMGSLFVVSNAGTAPEIYFQGQTA